MPFKHLARWSKRGLCPRCGSPLTTRQSNITPATGGTTTTRCTECAYEVTRQTAPAYKPF